MFDEEPAERHFLGLSPAGFHRNAYWEWPAAQDGAPTLLAVHGLTRNGRDFDGIARVLSAKFRVVCPDVVGRGHSERLPDSALYGYPQYLADASALIARLGFDSADWLGTSMGGLMGLMLAAQKQSPIRRLILNDVGPLVPKTALERIGTYVGKDEHFTSITEVETYLRRVHAPFGTLSDAEWARLARFGALPLPLGGYALAYDPGIGAVFQGLQNDVDLWVLWEQVACPVLILRGAESDLLTADIAAEMVRRKPAATLIEFPDCGHAPALFDPAQIAAVAEWLARA